MQHLKKSFLIFPSNQALASNLLNQQFETSVHICSTFEMLTGGGGFMFLNHFLIFFFHIDKNYVTIQF